MQHRWMSHMKFMTEKSMLMLHVASWSGREYAGNCENFKWKVMDGIICVQDVKWTPTNKKYINPIIVFDFC